MELCKSAANLSPCKYHQKSISTKFLLSQDNFLHIELLAGCATFLPNFVQMICDFLDNHHFLRYTHTRNYTSESPKPIFRTIPNYMLWLGYVCIHFSVTELQVCQRGLLVLSLFSGKGILVRSLHLRSFSQSFNYVSLYVLI